MRYHNITKRGHVKRRRPAHPSYGLLAAAIPAGCQNPVTWDVKGGLPFDEEAETGTFQALAPSWISGVTFSGGDPLRLAEPERSGNLIEEIHESSGKTIWLYTGFLWGRHPGSSVSEKRGCPGGRTVRGSRKRCDPALEGSANQRVIDVKQTLKIKMLSALSIEIGQTIQGQHLILPMLRIPDRQNLLPPTVRRQGEAEGDSDGCVGM